MSVLRLHPPGSISCRLNFSYFYSPISEPGLYLQKDSSFMFQNAFPRYFRKPGCDQDHRRLLHDCIRTGFFYPPTPHKSSFLSLFLVFQAAGLITFRYGIRKVLRFIRLKGYDSRQVLIVGRNMRSDLITQRILALRNTAFEFSDA